MPALARDAAAPIPPLSNRTNAKHDATVACNSARAARWRDPGLFRRASAYVLGQHAGIDPGRTRHFHVKVQAAAESPVLTTQFYFPDEPRNAEDDWFHPELLMHVVTTDDAVLARFDVVLAMR